MVISELELISFRNYTKESFQFHPGLNYIHGLNGQGKTNLIEAIYLLTHLRSFRTASLKNLVQENQDFAIIKANISKSEVSHEAKISLLQNQKKVWLDQKNLSLSSEYIQNFFSLLFAPDILTSYKENPSEKRSFIDRTLVSLDPFYLQKLKEFNQIRGQKNIVLKNKDRKQLSVWNQMLAKVIPYLVQKRETLTEKINQILPEIFHQLTGRDEILTFHYKMDLEGKTEIEEKKIFQFYQEKALQEEQAGYSLQGPQRDSFWMTLDQKSDKVSFSQGEQRVTFLALLLGINRLIQKELRFSPILLLDDLFSELDHQVVNNTLNYLAKEQNQTFITSTFYPKELIGLGNPIEIQKGHQTGMKLH